MRYEVICSCRDCTGSDPMGCYDGEEWSLGEFDTLDDAIEAGHIEVDDVGPWEYRIVELTPQNK